MDKYVVRLAEEWLQHGRIIIAVDFDSTVSPWETIDNPEDIGRCWALLIKATEVGCYIVVHTACNPDRYEEINSLFEAHGLKVDAINKNALELPYGNHGKPYFNILLDDRAGFREAMDTLEKAMYHVIGASKPHYADVA